MHGVREAFVDWIAYHLSNFQFRRSWKDWTDCLSAEDVSQKQLFVREVLDKCMRLSYHQRVLDIVPASFAPLVPTKPHASFKYASDAAASDLPGAAIAQQLAQEIRNKCTSEDILLLLRSCPNPIGGSDSIAESSFNPLKIDVLVQTLLSFGTKSFSHSFAALAKYHQALKQLTDNSEEAQLCALQAVFEMWGSHRHMMVVLVDKLLKMQIVECAAVVNWIFSKEMQNEFTRMYVWEIMLMTLSKMSKHVNKLKMEVEEARAIAEQSAQITEDDLSRLEATFENAQTNQRNLLLMVFQRFTILLTEHLLQSEAEGTDYNTHWYRWVIGRLREIFLTQYNEVSKYVATLETLLFTSDIDPHILEVFHQFRALKNA